MFFFAVRELSLLCFCCRLSVVFIGFLLHVISCLFMFLLQAVSCTAFSARQVDSCLCYIFVAGCQLYGFFGTTGALAEIWSLCAITLDRAQAIIHPLDTNKRLNTSQVTIAITQTIADILTLLIE